VVIRKSDLDGDGSNETETGESDRTDNEEGPDTRRRLNYRERDTVDGSTSDCARRPTSIGRTGGEDGKNTEISVKIRGPLF